MSDDQVVKIFTGKEVVSINLGCEDEFFREMTPDLSLICAKNNALAIVTLGVINGFGGMLRTSGEANTEQTIVALERGIVLAGYGDRKDELVGDAMQAYKRMSSEERSVLLMIWMG